MLFYRLKIGFEATMFAISRLTTIIFIVVYILCFILSFLHLVLIRISTSQSTDLQVLVQGISLILAVFIIFMLSSLFIYKLIAVNKSCKSEESQQKLISSITKMSLLFSVSIISLLLSAIFVGVTTSLNLGSSHTHFVNGILVTIDLMTNFMSVFLTFGHFEKYYLKICGCADAKCKSLCKCMFKSPETNLSRVVSETNAESTQTKEVETNDTINNIL